MLPVTVYKGQRHLSMSQPLQNTELNPDHNQSNTLMISILKELPFPILRKLIAGRNVHYAACSCAVCTCKEGKEMRRKGGVFDQLGLC